MPKQYYCLPTGGLQPVNNQANRSPISWDEAFAHRYVEWSAHMTADVAFYVEIARRTDGEPSSSLPLGTAVLPSL